MHTLIPVEWFMKESSLTSLATFFIVALFLATMSSGLFHVSPQNVLASKNLTEGERNRHALLHSNQIHKNKLWEKLQVHPILNSNPISHNNTLSSAIVHPSITIANPQDNHTLLTNFIITNITASASGGIKKSSIADRNHGLVIPITHGNSPRWSFPVLLPQVTINHTYSKRIAFVEPTFTYAAYRNGSFYDFYTKYNRLTNQPPIPLKLPALSTIKSDLNLLQNRPIPHGPFLYYAYPTQPPEIPYINYFKILLQQVKSKDPFVTNITDVDVHEGKIFHTNGSNAYDVLFLFHNEYVTESEYNNLKQFVSDGGTIVFTEANTLYAEVSFNKANDSITFVKGHQWRFDGKSANRSIGERWLDENKNWTGSNFLDITSNIHTIHLNNNPFNYTHGEEQYVTNPHAKILLDYHVSFLTHKYVPVNATVATYRMDYGKGKIINLGIWGHELTNNTAFLNYFDNVIIPIALGPNEQINSKMK
jgi:hypothetical protein